MNEPHVPTDRDVRAIRSALLAHYDAHARDLPWRRTRDPYAIWVSEIMLQQTRVETVLRYYDRFLARFPDLASLAAADEDAVLAAWSGLGYYRRARMLHAGVREVLARYGGRVPEAASERRSLPGVGRYTAGAIGSIAFEREEPLVDGNVARVFARLFAVDTPLGRSDTQNRLWALAERMVRGDRPGSLNQALMELGARVCTPAAVSCDSCPVAKHCQAHAQQRVRELPVAKPKPAPKLRELVAVLVRDADERVLLLRNEAGLFAGLWNLPMREGRAWQSAAALLAEHGVCAKLKRKPCAELEHVLTHRHLRIRLFTGELENPLPAKPELRLQPEAALHELGVSRLTHKALEAARVARLARI